jgi:tetratricopeptide (TPR) repeat protein
MTANTPTKQLLRQAVSHFQAGRLAEARSLCHQVLTADQHLADAQHLWGVLELRRGDFESAIKSISRALELGPARAEYHNSLGVAYSKNHQLAHAIHHFWLVLASEPKNLGAMQNLAQALRDAGYAREALRISQEAVALDPEAVVEPAWLCEVARQFRETGRLTDAIAAYRRVLRVQPDLLAAQVGLMQALEQDGQVQESLAATDALLKQQPRHAEALKNRGILCMQLGWTEEAVRSLEQALEVNPRYAEAYRVLTQVRRFQPSDPLIAQMAALCCQEATPESDRQLLHFALGKVYEDVHDYDQAFAQYAAGNALHRQQVHYDPRDTVLRVNALVEFFTPQRFAQLGDRFAIDSALPIFVVGLPRSGTSLVEQILASHPLVHGAGELEYLRRLIDRIPTLVYPSASYPYCLERLSPGLARQLATEYVDALAVMAPHARHVTDKMPWNFYTLGLMELFWPHAKIIHCRRDPLDTCWSCYTRYFSTGQPFAWDLVELGHYYRQYERLAAHWRMALPIQVWEVQYEELVADPERGCRDLLQFCGLEWDPHCLDFHQTQRPVKTEPGVRQPVYRSSIARWRRFEAHLAPLRQALAGEVEPNAPG